MAFPRILGWLIPGVCMAGAMMVVYRQSVNLREAQNQHDAALGEVVAATKLKETMMAMGDDKRYAAVSRSSEEQTEFLTDLKSRAAVAGVVITNWTTQVSILGAQAQSTSSDTLSEGDKAALLTGLVRIKSNMTIQGEFGSIQTFLKDLISNDRLFTLTNITWSRSQEGTTLAVTICRYVNSEGASSDADLSGPGQPVLTTEATQ